MGMSNMFSDSTANFENINGESNINSRYFDT